ncbi:MAG: aquaporin [Ilumatobacteraceae bacterium]
MESNARILAAETIGTAVFVLGGVGTAVLSSGVGTFGIALGFALAAVVAAVLVGHASGAHLNPAVSIGLVLARKIPGNALPFYLIGQFLGAFIGAAGGVEWPPASTSSTPRTTSAERVRRPQPDRLRHRAIIVVEVIFTAVDRGRTGDRARGRLTRSGAARSAGWSPSSTSSRCRSTTPD